MDRMNRDDLFEYAKRRDIILYEGDIERMRAVLKEKVSILDALENMGRDELKKYARKECIKLYTTVPAKMRRTIMEAKYRRAHHGDAFRY